MNIRLANRALIRISFGFLRSISFSAQGSLFIHVYPLVLTARVLAIVGSEDREVTGQKKAAASRFVRLN
jgi:hypothetical protein